MHAPAKERSSVAALIGPPPCACVDTYFPTALATSARHVLLVRTAAVSTSSAIRDFCTSSNCGRITFNKSTGACSGALPARYQSASSAYCTNLLASICALKKFDTDASSSPFAAPSFIAQNHLCLSWRIFHGLATIPLRQRYLFSNHESVRRRLHQRLKLLYCILCVGPHLSRQLRKRPRSLTS